MMAEVSNTFCVLPWMHVATNAAGTLRVCCNSTPGKNGLEHPEGGKYKLHKHDLREAWNCDTMKNIRQQFINGERPEMCERCFREEDVGVRSARQGWNESWYDPTADYSSTTPEPKAQYIDLRLGNLCNLKCRMCNPYASNQWVDEWNLVEDPLPEEELKRLDTDTMTWPNKQRVWENLMNVADSIEEIYLTGGEPTLALKQYDLFQYLQDKDFAKHIKLKYNTNLTNIPERMVWYWHFFKLVKINASIDAVGVLDRYVRYPSAWPKIEENFKKLRRLRNTRLQIHSTIQTYNILDLPKLYDWCDSIMFEDVYLNILNHPKCLNIRTLPTKIKKLVEEKLQPYMNRPKVKQMINYMNKEDWYDTHWKEFVDYTNALDKSRNENILDLVPEFGEFWNV
jgi:sulfatase maturation enzyme AslB (radical SAM superfamily)